MNPSTDYDGLKKLAREKRCQHSVVTSKLGRLKMRQIYKVEGVRIDDRSMSQRIRAIYMCDDGDPSVAINKKLPDEPRLFSLAHELKHHFLDQDLIENGEIRCGDYNANERIEKAAEVFAAEFIYPEEEFVACLHGLGIKLGCCQKEDVVRLKCNCGATVSYTFLQKRLERLGYAQPGAFNGVQFKKLEESIYGLPIYKQPWFKSRRARALSRY